MGKFKTYVIEYADADKSFVANNEKIVSIRCIYITTVPTPYNLHDVQLTLNGQDESHVVRSWSITSLNLIPAVYNFLLENFVPRKINGKTNVDITGWNTVTPNIERVIIETETID